MEKNVDLVIFSGQTAPIMKVYSLNLIHGKGCYKWSDYRIYTGDWANNKMHGFGIFLWPDGKKYEGNYKDDKKEGYGIYRWNKNKFYDGQWENGKRNGVGTLFSGKKTKKGIWTDGKLTKDFNKNDTYSEDYQSIGYSCDYQSVLLKKSSANLISPNMKNFSSKNIILGTKYKSNMTIKTLK